MNKKIFELIRYLIVGVLTTVVSLGVYYALVYTVLNPGVAIELQIANVISWICAVVFAYIANRIFVFQSKNKSVVKEATSFVGSRIITLLMDMGIMFLGVTVLSYNDKIIKLVSQVVITVANYIFSKLFVFGSVKKKFSIKLIWVLYLLPFLEFASFYFNLDLLFVEVIILLMLIIGCYKSKGYRFIISFILFYMVISVLYLYCKELDVGSGLAFLIKVFTLPIALCYFLKNNSVSKRMIFNLFVLYVTLFIVPLTITTDYQMKNHVMAIILVMMPIVVDYLFHHQNNLVKYLGFLIIFLLIYLWQAKILVIGLILSVLLLKNVLLLVLALVLGIVIFLPYNDFSFVFDNRLLLVSQNFNVFTSSNIEEQVFGIINSSLTYFDLPDIFFNLGYVGFISYVLVIVFLIMKMKVPRTVMASLFLLLISSIFCGSSLINFAGGIIFGLIAGTTNKKSVLLISNKYPSRKYRYSGLLVKESIAVFNDYDVDKIVLKRHDNRIVRIISKFIFDLKINLKIFYYSYDYFYVFEDTDIPDYKLKTRCIRVSTENVNSDIYIDYQLDEDNHLKEIYEETI